MNEFAARVQLPTRLCYLMAIAIVSYSSSGCEADDRVTPQVQMQPLAIAVVSLNEDKIEDRLATTIDYLNEQLDEPVTLEVVDSEEIAIDRLVRGQVEMAFLQPGAYVRAKQRNPHLNPIVAPIDRTTGEPWYRTIIMADTEAEVDTVADLKGKVVGFWRDRETIDSQVAIAHFRSLGMEPENDFAEVRYYPDDERVVRVLTNGEVAAIVTTASAYSEYENTALFDDDRFKIVWESEAIPKGPIVVSPVVSPPQVSQIGQALLGAPPGLSDDRGVEVDGYAAVSDGDYDAIRQ